MWAPGKEALKDCEECFKYTPVYPIAIEKTIEMAYNYGQFPFLIYGERSSTWLEHQIVDLGVAGSIPVAHPNSFLTDLIHRNNPVKK